MNSRLLPRALPLAVAACSAWQSAELVRAWRDAPFDQLGWLSFLVWVLPAVWALRHCPAREDQGLLLTALALVLVVAGLLLDLNALRYLALALALGAWVPASVPHAVWLLGAVAWMPLFGWLARDLSPNLISALRLLLAAATTAPWLLRARNVPPA